MPTQAEDEKKPDFVESFEAFYRENNYPQALIVATKYPELKKTSEYAAIQEHFQILLKLAARYAKKGEIQKAKELIGEYARVEEKKVIVKLLLLYGEEFLRFLKAVNEEDLEYIFNMTEKIHDFAKVPSFVTLQEKMHKRLSFLETRMDAMDFDEDFSVLRRWESFLPEAKRVQEKLRSLQRLQEHFEKEEWSACYSLIEEDALVKNSLLAQLLQKHWYKSFEKAKRYAKEGDIAGMYAVLKDFVAMESKQEDIKTLIYGATRREIARLIENGAYQKAEKMLFEAVERFGRRSELMDLAQAYYEQSGVKVVFG